MCRRAFPLLLVLLAACGGARPASPIVLRFLEAPDVGGGWHAIIDRFEAENPGIRVDMVEGPPSTDTREEMYAAAFLSGDAGYDLVYMDVPWVPKFAAHGWLRPLDTRMPASARAEFLPADITGSTWQGHLYRVPMQTDAGMLYYRTDLVPGPPRTFDDLVRMARAAQHPPERWGFVFEGLQYEGLVTTFLEVLWGYGGRVIDADDKVALDSPAAERALEWLTGLVGTIAPRAVTAYQEEDARQAFQEGRAVFMRNWPYAWTLLQKPGSAVAGKVGIAPMPHAPGAESAATLGGWGFGIAASTPHADEAWRFIAFATSAAGQKVLHLRNGRIPTRRALFDDPDILAESPYYKALLPVLLAARPRPVHPRYAEISAAIQRHVSAALVGRETPAAAVHAAASEIRAIVGER